VRLRTAVTPVTALAALLLTACAGTAPAVTPAPGVEPKPCGTLRLAVNPWVGYEANTAVVAYLARERLDCKVELIRAPETDSWKQLAAGDVDAILENWSHDDLKKTYIDELKVAVELGLTGNQGVLGWWVPPWMAEQYPDITNWKNLNKYADLFAKDGSGPGILYDGDPTFVTNDVALVKNLGLNYKVEYTGSEERLIEEFRKAERDRKPFLGYFYSPQWLLSELDLKQVQLPPYTPGCDADPRTVRCGYQPYNLDKIGSKEFAYSGSPAAELIQNFHWTDEDQNSVARDIADGGMTMDAAAKKWLDANPDVWRTWLPKEG
jgi:glycine betaine/proline transport system substrate-binding protein